MNPENAVLEGGPPRPGAGRRLAVDAARGVAVIAMVIYHTAWDLSQLSLIATDVTASPPWRAFARLIGGSFLFLAGVSLVLAHGRGIRVQAFLKRLGVLALAALAVTAATRIVFPDSYIFFGILHNVAVSSLVALPFVRRPAAAAAVAGAAFLAAPLAARPAFDAAWLSFLGLGTRIPVTDDFVPLFPWTGMVLLGVAAARLAQPFLGPPRARPHPKGLGPALAALGRRSLVIYLVHQPVIFGALYGLREAVGPDPAAEAAPFLASCAASCRPSGQAAELCGRSCGCTVEELKRDGLWPVILSGRPSPEEVARASALARICLDRVR